MQKFKTLSLFFLLLLISKASWDGKLKFNEEDSKFKILQLTDLHFGENPSYDIRSQALMYRLIGIVQPDLVVLSGDMFSGYASQCHGDKADTFCYEHGWASYTLPLRAMRQNYAIIMGNHDGQANLDSKQIIALDQTSTFSLTQQSPSGVSDGSNYYLPIYDDEGENIESLIWMFDSHEEGCMGLESPWGCVEKDQIEWFNKKYKELLVQTGKDVIQSVSFVHIPLPEYVTLYNEQEVQGNQRESICCPCQNSGLTDALLLNDVQANYVGHDHDNDFSGFYSKGGKKVELHYGRKSGYGSYGPPKDMIRGGTVISITNMKNGIINVESQVIDEMGNLIPKSKPEKRQNKVANCPC